MSGGKTQIGNLFTAILSVLTLLFLLPLFSSLADAALAALVIVVMGDIRYFFGLWRIDRVEFALGVAAFAGVLVFDVLGGVMIGVILALLVLADHIRRPTTAVVGRKPTGAFVDTDDHDDAE